MAKDEPRPASQTFAARWKEYRETVLPAVAERISPATINLVQMSFYCGATSMLDLVGMILDESDSREAVEAALERLYEEVDGFLEAGDGEVN